MSQIRRYDLSSCLEEYFYAFMISIEFGLT